jgi:hypothetical protein
VEVSWTYVWKFGTNDVDRSLPVEDADSKSSDYNNLDLEAPPGFEPGMEVLQGHPRWFLDERELT